MVSRSSVQFLFVDRGQVQKPRRLEGHSHPFWQLEIFTAGTCRAMYAQDGMLMQAGDVLLIPAGVTHAFDYHRAGCAWLSLKFSLSGPRPTSAGQLHGDDCASLAAALVALLAGAKPPTPAQAEAAGHLIAGLVSLAGHKVGGSTRPASLPDQAAALVEAGDGQRWTVAALARRMGVGPGHLSTRFQAERGQLLKVYIDQQRAACAEALLTDPSLPLSKIADLLEFPDEFSFSRFFKRVRGQSPSSWRRR